MTSDPENDKPERKILVADSGRAILSMAGLLSGMLSVAPALGMDFGFPMPRIRKGNKYTPPVREVPDFSTMTRQQRRRLRAQGQQRKSEP